MATKQPKPLHPPYFPKKPGEAKPFAVGTPVIIIRPHLWSNCVAVVERVDDRQMHELQIIGKDGSRYTSVAWADQLRPWPWGDVTWSEKL